MDTTKADELMQNTPEAAKKVTETVDVCARCGGRHTDILFRPLAKPQVIKGPIVVTHWAPCPTTGQPISRFLTASDELVRDSDSLAVAAATDHEKDELAAALQRTHQELADLRLVAERRADANRELQKVIDSGGATYRDDKTTTAEYKRLVETVHAAPNENPTNVFRAAADEIEHSQKLHEGHADHVVELETQLAAAVKDRDDWKLLAELAGPAAAVASAADEEKPKKRK